MKYTFILLVLFSAGCCNGNFPIVAEQYKYGDKIRITKGFFENCEGIITATATGFSNTSYSASIICPTDSIPHKELVYWSQIERVQ